MAVGDNIEHGSRVTKLAQSDHWAAAQRVMVIVGVPALLALSGTFGGLILNETIQNGKEVASHTTDITDIKVGVEDIKKNGAVDHDHLLGIDGVILVINTKLEQLPLLWSAISRNRNPAAPDKPQP